MKNFLLALLIKTLVATIVSLIYIYFFSFFLGKPNGWDVALVALVMWSTTEVRVR